MGRSCISCSIVGRSYFSKIVFPLLKKLLGWSPQKMILLSTSWYKVCLSEFMTEKSKLRCSYEAQQPRVRLQAKGALLLMLFCLVDLDDCKILECDPPCTILWAIQCQSRHVPGFCWDKHWVLPLVWLSLQNNSAAGINDIKVWLFSRHFITNDLFRMFGIVFKTI